MIICSIDVQEGRAVQLVRGERREVDAGDPRPLAARFDLVGETAIIDLDAAMGTGDNTSLVRELVASTRARVGGGIRSVEAARAWLDAGAEKVILGTAATPEVLAELPRTRVIAALDARDGEVVVEGWRTPTGARVLDRMRELSPYVGGFLVTFVENEGTLAGLGTERVLPLREAAGDRHLTVAGGVRSAEEVAALDALGVDVQVGMALYRGLLHPADALAAMLHSDRPDGLWPTVIVDEHGVALGLAYSNAESLRLALDSATGVYLSRSRGVWRKGATSGQRQKLLRVDLDCDRDALRFTVCQEGASPAFCHLGLRSCWGRGQGLGELARSVRQPTSSRDASSYTTRLLREEGLLPAKLVEEAHELADAVSHDEVVHEAADLAYFLLARLAQAGVGLDEVERELDRRARRLTRRGGGRKPS